MSIRIGRLISEKALMKRRRKNETADAPSEERSETAELIHQIKTQNELLRSQIRYLSSWRIRIAHGLLFGLGSFLGATILVSMAAYVLKPLLSIELFRPAIEQVIQDLESPGIRTPLPQPNGGNVAPQYMPDRDPESQTARPEPASPEPPERG